MRQETISGVGVEVGRQDPRRAAGYALVAIAAVGWGTWPLILRHAPMPASLQSAIVITVITIFSFPLALVELLRRRAARRADEDQRPKLVHWLLGIGWLAIADALNIALFFAAYQRTSVAIAVLTHYLTPVFVALGAPLILRERLQRRTMLAVAISFGGLVLLLEPWRGDLSAGDLTGALLGSGSAVFYASNVLVSKRLFRVFSASELMFFHCLAGLPLLWLMVPTGSVAAASPTALAVVIAGSIGPGAIGGLSFVGGLRRIAASHASILTLLEPFVAVLVAALVLGQTVGPIPMVGGASILIGALLVITLRPQRP